MKIRHGLPGEQETIEVPDGTSIGDCLRIIAAKIAEDLIENRDKIKACQ